MERGVAPFLVSQQWEPFYPMHMFGVFASRWPLEDHTIWTIVNRNEYDVQGQQMSVPFKQDMHYFDLYHGEELTPQHEGENAILSFTTEAHGYGMILATPGAPSAAMRQLMSRMKEMTKTQLSSLSHEWKTLPQQLVEIPSTPLASSEPKGMVKIPGGNFVFKVEGIEIEGSNDMGVDVQYPWEDTPRRFHEHRMQIKPFYADKYPVTNTEFKEFLDATHYRPKDDHNFLGLAQRILSSRLGQKARHMVSLEDARAYAKWAGKRLSHESEWQFSAQGTDGRAHPWGTAWDASAVPIPDQSRTMRGLGNVDEHSGGASPFGVMNPVGNVWQWTDE